MKALAANRLSPWVRAWPDALAFAGGLALAWFGDWDTKDLVWSLWLSSLVVGYAMIVWSIFGPAAFLRAKNRPMLPDTAFGSRLPGSAALLIGGLFLLSFFTVHFGMFHFVHSVFLNAFFPVAPDLRSPSVALYEQVLTSYWPFVLAAAVAEREAFHLEPTPEAPPDPATAARNARRAMPGGMMAPYRNVVRLHLLIFFFAFAHFTKLDRFLVYAVVYAVYFFPWRLIKREPGVSVGQFR